MVLGKNWPFFHLYISGNIGQQNIFYSLERKSTFLGFKNQKCKKSKQFKKMKKKNKWKYREQ